MQHQDDEHRRYARTAGGAFIEVVESRAGATNLPEGAEELTEEEWETERAAWETALSDHVAQLEEVDRVRHEGSYAALVAVGVPEAAARDLSGLRGDPAEPA